MKDPQLHIDKDGNIYKGELANGERHGKGLLIYKNGDSYKGEFQFDHPHGSGKYISKNGQNIFKGIWEHGTLKVKTKVVKSESSESNQNKRPLRRKIPIETSLRSLSRPRSQLRLSVTSSNQKTQERHNNARNKIPGRATLRSLSPSKNYVVRHICPESPPSNWTRSSSYKAVDARNPSPSGQIALVEGLKAYSSPPRHRMNGRIVAPERSLHLCLPSTKRGMSSVIPH
jgi:hypothetical protein